jgi:hypothetical protein
MSIAQKYRDVMKPLAPGIRKCIHVQPNGSFTLDEPCMKRTVSKESVGSSMSSQWTEAERAAVSQVLKGGA